MAVGPQRTGLTIAVAAMLLFPAATLGIDGPQTLFSQAAQAALDREFYSSALSYVLLDAHAGTIIAQRWPHADDPIPVGSLIKPFTALAYARRHRTFPDHVCEGQRDSCWLLHGHGRLTLSDAIAQSCNAYFLALARDISADDANVLFRAYNLPPVNASNKSRALAGLSNDWQVSPVVLARAYAMLSQQLQISAPEIYSGMQRSANVGTARAVSFALPGRSVLAKTGTARCTHSPPGVADGFTVVIYPADNPRIVLLTRIHNVTGATAAVTAAQMLRLLEAGQP